MYIGGMHRLAIVACLLVSALDCLQLVVREWQTARLGAVGGALLYAIAAVLLARRHAVGVWMVRLIPLIPTTIVVGAALTWTQPDPWMLGIYTVQLLAAVATIGTPSQQSTVESLGPTNAP